MHLGDLNVAYWLLHEKGRKSLNSAPRMSSKSIDASHCRGFTSHSPAEATVKFVGNGWYCCWVDYLQHSKHVLCFFLWKASKKMLSLCQWVGGWVMESENGRDNLIFSLKESLMYCSRETENVAHNEEIWVRDWIRGEIDINL